MTSTPPKIAFDELLALTDGDHQHAAWLALQMSKGGALEQALGLYKTALMNLERCRQSYESGHGEAVMTALNYCIGIFHFPMPQWLTDAWNNAYTPWRYHEVKTLDAALGIQRKHLNARRKEVMYSGFVWIFINRHHDNGAALDDALFELAADEVNKHAPDDLKIGKTKAKEMYYGMRRLIESRQYKNTQE